MRAPANDLPIVFDAVTLRRGDVTVVDGVSLILRAGQPTVLIGPNGAGKTSLLKLAMGLVNPTAGCITWGGREHAPSRQRAIVFQRPIMLRRSTAANIRYALAAAGYPRSDRNARVAALLDLVGLSKLGDRPARRLSGGEQQRLALARAFSERAGELSFLDEPTATVDPAATKGMEALIATIANSGIKVVISTHNLGQARRITGDIVLMHRGRIVERADTASFFATPETREAQSFIAGELLV